MNVDEVEAGDVEDDDTNAEPMTEEASTTVALYQSFRS
jgi:hypothetical protein